ncbi:MAG TPA: ATP-binding protein [Pseudobdellovibrionaceae bacterium]|nr:ATP-binding protein [Pseudobdellovibrionaceae bacterium]
MFLQRSVYQDLLEWKSSPRRKPLIFQGARQVGKTFLLKHFGAVEYEDCAYFNFERDPSVLNAFEHQLDPKSLINTLSILREKKIEKGKTLIILDEIQKSSDALNSLKYFNEEANEYHIIAAGSLLGIALNHLKSFPVGKVNFLNIYPLTFSEFIEGSGLGELNKFLQGVDAFEPIPDPLHEKLIGLLRIYYVIGGMPEVVAEYLTNKDFNVVRDIQNEILTSYENDFSKYTEPDLTSKIRRTWTAIPSALSKENKKFQYSEIIKGARARAYESSIDWLTHAGLIYKVNCIEKVGLPLEGYSINEIFKLYSFDIGLLGAQLGVSPKLVIHGHELFTELKGALAENYILQEFKAQGISSIYYWRSKNTAEVDFLISIENQLFPIEVKAGVDRNTRSLREYQKQNKSDKLFRFTLRNLKKDQDLHNLPLYMAGNFKKLNF